MPQTTDDQRCFVCGPDNPDGLHLTFSFVGNQAQSFLSIPTRFQGWQGIVHGGIVATLLDEVMAKAVRFAGHQAVTVDINVQYKKPTPVDVPLQLSGRVTEIQRRIVSTEGELRTQDGTMLACAKARFFIS